MLTLLILPLYYEYVLKWRLVGRRSLDVNGCATTTKQLFAIVNNKLAPQWPHTANSIVPAKWWYIQAYIFMIFWPMIACPIMIMKWKCNPTFLMNKRESFDEKRPKSYENVPKFSFKLLKLFSWHNDTYLALATSSGISCHNSIAVLWNSPWADLLFLWIN